MSEDPFITYDAAYVLGALSPEDRHAFEQHLRSCDGCAQAVKELAGLPGLLARAAIDDPVETSDQLHGMPDLLPGLLFAVRREQRRRRWVSVSGWVAAAACAVAIVVLALRPTAAPATAQPPSTAAPMTAVADAPIAAQVSLTKVAWGTKIELKCSYPGQYEVGDSYELFILDANGNWQQVGSWTATASGSATLNAATALVDTDIAEVQVRTAQGTAVLELKR